MTNIFIDPYILAYPSEDDSPTSNELERYLENILSWRNLKDFHLTDIFTSKQASDILIEYNNYPYWDSLKATLTKTGLNEYYQPRDIIEVIEGLLQLRSIEEKLNLIDVLFDDVEIDPDDYLAQRPIVYTNEFKKILLLMSLDSHLNLDYDNLLISRDVEQKKISVKGEIHFCEFSEEKNVLVFPLLIESNCTLCSHISELLLNICPSSLWRKSKNMGDYKEILNIFINQRLIKMGQDVDNIPRWKIGEKFIDSCRSLGFLHQESKINSLFRACADTILSHNLNSTHALRINEGGSSPQVTRSEDKAWRRDIDYEYHLHYWQTIDGPELASVVVHNDMVIPA